MSGSTGFESEQRNRELSNRYGVELRYLTIINLMRLKTTYILIFLFIRLAISYPQNQLELIKTIESGDLETFKQQVELMFNINMTLENGYTVLNYSIITGRVDLVEYLLSKNVDIEMPSNKQTPLMLSARNNTNILELLISKGADINREINGKSAITSALDADRKDAIAILEAHGATLELKWGVDGPYIFYDTLRNITTMVNVDAQSEIIVDTLKKPPSEVVVKTPSGDSFKVPLKKPTIEKKSIYKKAEKIFAMSDIEGNYHDFVNSLKNNEIIDNNYNWIFGNGHLVLLGDFVDRGKYVTQVLWLIYKLEQEAEKMGGKVHFILGNHEEMNLLDDYRYDDIRYKILAYKLGINFSDFYSKRSELGAWLRTKNVVEKIGNNLFVHAGISDSVLYMNLSIPKINEIARNVFSSPQPRINKEANLVLSDYGVLWYRGYITEEENYVKIPQNSVNKILRRYNANRLIVGHTIVSDISTDYKGKLIRLDVDHYNNIASGILIIGDKIYKVKDTGEKELLYGKK